MKYIGIDGGGTKTKFALFNEKGHIEKEVLKPTVHILNQSKEKCTQYLKEGVEELDPNHNAYVIAGLAGYGQQQEIRQLIDKVCDEAFTSRKYTICSDVEIAIQGALAGQDGIVVIAGTGSIALSSLNGQLKRCGGWGYQLGDEGSAYWIAKKMLSVYCQEIDGRREKTVLYDLIKETCHLQNDYDIITYMNALNHDRRAIASLAKINALAVQKGDRYALSIYRDAAHEIAQLIKTLAQDFTESFNVSYIGGVFCSGEMILQPLKEQLSSLPCQLIAPVHPPEYGAFIIGKKKYGKKEKRKENEQ